MNAGQQIKKKQLVRIIEAYKQDKQDYDTIPALTDAFGRLEEIDDEIDEATGKQILATVGTTQTKNETKVVLANRGSMVAGAIYSWASDTGNSVIQAQVNFTEQALLKLSDTIIGPTCRNIYSLAIANADGIKKYIDANLVQQFVETIDLYAAMNGKPLKQIKDRGTETQKIASLLAEAASIYKKKTNKLVEQLKEKFPATYNNYQIALDLPKQGDDQKGDNPPPTPPAA